MFLEHSGASIRGCSRSLARTEGVAFTIDFLPTITDIFIHQVKNGQLELLGNSKAAKLG